MRKILLTLALLLPLISFSQHKADDYTIYSGYFRDLDSTRGPKHTFVVRVSADYSKKGEDPGISSVLDDFRVYVKNKTVGQAFFKNYFLMDTLKKDTLWLPLISKLENDISKPHVIRNDFDKDLGIFMLPYNEYIKYFDKENRKDFDDGWAAFHENYPDHGIMTDLSEVVSDGKRAVFYAGWRCGVLCGEGSLVMFYNDGSGWRLVTSITLWNS